MQKPLIKKLVLTFCLIAAMPFTSAAHAAGCKVKVQYSNFPFSNKIVGSERYTIHAKSTATTLRKHMRVLQNYGEYDVKIKYWDVSGNHWKIVRKGTSRKVSGDLKKVQCLNTPRKTKTLKFKGKGYWRSTSSNRPKGVYERIVTSLRVCKKRCLKSSKCNGIEYTTIYAAPRESVCELHSDRFSHIASVPNPKMGGKVWVKQ